MGTFGAFPTSPSSIESRFLAADVVNDATNVIADVTGLSFPVVAGLTYWFRFVIQFESSGAGNGSRWSINGPAAPTALRFNTQTPVGTTSFVTRQGLAAYDLPAAVEATSASAAANIALIEGFITPSLSGNVIARFASELNPGSITAKAGSKVDFQRTL